MPLYRVNESGQFLPFEETPFPNLERVLEDWIEANPHLLLHGETIAFIGRQPRTQHGKFLDLLGVDESGACVIVELKRGETPRDVVAQALEYAAWIDSLTLEELDEMARGYALDHAINANGIGDMYHATFSPPDEDETGDIAPNIEHITFNSRQRLVIVAEHFSSEVEQTLRYLRTRLGVDITGLQFGVHRASEDTIVQTSVIVGRESTAIAATKAPASRTSAIRSIQTDESIVGRVTSDFVRRAVTGIEDWIVSIANPDLSFRQGNDIHGRRYIRIRGKNTITYYHAKDWLFCWLQLVSDEELKILRSRLGKPDEIKKTKKEHEVRFLVANDGDFAVLKEIVLSRLHYA